MMLFMVEITIFMSPWLYLQAESTWMSPQCCTVIIVPVGNNNIQMELVM